MFLEFGEIIRKDNSNFGVTDVKIDYEKFKELAKKYLTEIFVYNVNSIIKTYSKLFNWEIPKTKIRGIRDILINNYNKKYGAMRITRITETTKKH